MTTAGKPTASRGAASKRAVSKRAASKGTAKERLTTPLVRVDGELRPATWDEALDRVAGGLRSVVDEHGPRAVGMFSCSKATNEVNYAAQRFARAVIGTNNIDSCNRT